MRISPKKAREVARVLPGRKATEGISLLKYIPRKAARKLTRHCVQQWQMQKTMQI